MLTDEAMDATKAVQNSDYSPCDVASARAIDHKLMHHKGVIGELQRRIQERSASTGITPESVIASLAAVAFSDVSDVLDWNGSTLNLKPLADIPDWVRASIASITVTPGRDGDVVVVKMVDKLRALELLGKHTGALIDRREISGPGGGPIGLVLIPAKVPRGENGTS